MSARIVVADDDVDIRRLIMFTLKRRGYTILEATNGQAAIELIRAETPDLAIIDVMMPLMSGLEVAKILTASPATANIPILMLSAKGQSYEINEGITSGASDYIVKPFTPQDLVARVERLLKKTNL